MLVQMSTGRAVQMSLDEYLNMTDDDVKSYVAHEQGYILNHPFVETCLLDLVGERIEEQETDEYEDNSLYSDQDLEDFMSSDSYGEIN